MLEEQPTCTPASCFAKITHPLTLCVQQAQLDSDTGSSEVFTQGGKQKRSLPA